MSLSKPADSKYNKRINFGKLLNLIPSQELQVKLLQDFDILPKSNTCDKCQTTQHEIEYRGNYVFFRCRTCYSQTSVRSGTVLSKSRMS